MLKKFRSNGKLLITSEYLVLDGAEAFAIPSKLGQSLEVHENDFFEDQLSWESYTDTGKKWFFASFDANLNVLKSSDQDISNRLSLILKAAEYLNPNFKLEIIGKKVQTHLEFPRDWGLGSSSTLISNISQWANVDPFKLQQESFPGSGYDIACSFSNSPIIYQIINREPSFISFSYDSPIKDELIFVHLNKKQSSAQQISSYKSIKFDKEQAIDKFTELSKQIVNTQDLNEFAKLISIHEKMLSQILGVKPIKQILFPDFRGAVKSLGAWGGDFVMAVGENSKEYFRSKGYNTILSYRDFLY